jgi:hypothetical protein
MTAKSILCMIATEEHHKFSLNQINEIYYKKLSLTTPKITLGFIHCKLTSFCNLK